MKEVGLYLWLLFTIAASSLTVYIYVVDGDIPIQLGIATVSLHSLTLISIALIECNRFKLGSIFIVAGNVMFMTLSLISIFKLQKISERRQRMEVLEIGD